MYELGANWDKNGVHFSIYSKNATKIELCLFEDSSNATTLRIDLQKDVRNDIWHAYVPNLKPGQTYAYQVHGNYDPNKGHRFEHNKMMLDPYAKEIVKDKNNSHETILKARVIDPNYDWENITPPNTPWEKTIIYELHPKGFSVTNTSIPRDNRGKFTGLSHPETIKYIKDLGITAVELMPIHAHLNEDHLNNKGKSNYWGYNTIGFFAPHPEYLQSNSINELKDTIKEFHRNGIEVILDVVYNHTAEGGQDGPSYSFKGIDNKTYYRLNDNNQSTYINETGCGNTLNITNPAVCQMVIDSLRYWVKEFHIDGFRFDLATSLGRNPDHFCQENTFFKAIKNDPLLSKTKLIAEPWDIGPDGYKLGAFPPGWKEWNDRYRDEIRQYWRGDPGMSGKVAHRVSGSSSEFNKTNRGPFDSINFITAHDGFTLEDLVSYKQKHNLENGENNRDGHNHNFSENYNHEGKTNDPDIINLRQKQKRNMLATLFLSHGTPMLLAGDEIGNSQEGNNNAYCQDNKIGWLNWAEIKKRDRSLNKYVKNMISLRNKHPILTQNCYLHGQNTDTFGVPDIQWYSPNAIKKSWDDPHDNCFAVLFNSAVLNNKDNDFKNKKRLFAIFNSSANEVSFTLPKLAGSNSWVREIDTANTTQKTISKTYSDYPKYIVKPRSVAIFSQNTF